MRNGTELSKICNWYIDTKVDSIKQRWKHPEWNTRDEYLVKNVTSLALIKERRSMLQQWL